MKEINTRQALKKAGVALAALIIVAVAVGPMMVSQGMLAQVFSLTVVKPERWVYYVENNDFGATEGLSFKQNKVVTVKACGGGGGGGGGGRGNESGNNIGAGGGGGGGGGKGVCTTRNIKVRAGDVLRWNVGVGGVGGVGGEVDQNLHVTAYVNFVPVDTSPTDGGTGGATSVTLNGVMIVQADGGNGGQAGTNASSEYAPGIGGSGGSSNPALAGMWGHAGENGENEYMQANHMGGGGYGGSGEGQSGMLSNRGGGGSSWGPSPHGQNGGPAGVFAAGGGGAGGGGGRWEDYVYNQNDTSNFDNIFFGGPQVDSVRNHGGIGGNGGNGYVEFWW